MKKFFKDKNVKRVILLAVVIGLASTPVGQQFTEQLKPLIKTLAGF